MFVEYKAPFTPTTRPELLLWSKSEKTSESSQLKTRSASIVDILRPFDRFATECDRRKGEGP